MAASWWTVQLVLVSVIIVAASPPNQPDSAVQAAVKGGKARAAPAGQCDNESDRAIVFDKAWFPHVFSCGRSTYGSRDKSRDCLNKATFNGKTVSPGCSECWAESIACGASKCEWPCLFNSCASACIKCGHKNCDGALIACSGLNPLPKPCRKSQRLEDSVDDIVAFD
ncbi:unnamed protein product [Vitrella brassicaformis CCMP3155]|uniref:TNFR-Cys domain-containing protein n=2 Tax=Vitrella brassicaformis TaxID=1169539 RepID=A0A0G4EJ43_VITBC|nr:unnamed protein product [Vitrella brassicaformis CCMP3155]|eukprot:CEL96723.1 unnamed protein product [Vitrella brassicaformis CCMP3155]